MTNQHIKKVGLIQIPDKPKMVIVSFKSGHYKMITGERVWIGDGVWVNFQRAGGKLTYANRSEIEYYEEL